eukprot:jgi/Ulvmu1/363/UM001_0370.1
MAENWDEYVWIVVVGAFMAFFMAYGIGANDVANAFATSVGSKTLTLFQATILAGIFEFLGALLLGRGVTDTVKSGIADLDFFEDQPEILMYGMFCALIAAGTWLIVATYLELPVSTTHSIIGGIVGMALVAYGGDAVKWHDIDESETFPVKGISSVVISWIFSPVASGIVAVFFFLIARTFILRADNSYDRTFVFLPVLVFICIFINAFYVLDKGINKQWKWIKDHTERSAWIAAVVGAVALVISAFVSFWIKKRLHSQEVAKKEGGDVEKGDAEKPSSFFSRLSDAINSNDPHAVVDEDLAVKEMHDNAEVFDERTEGVFRYLQVLTSCCDAFAHGANDVANAVGPFAAIMHVYRKQDLTKKSDLPAWILLIGGTGIVIGLATYGYSIIKAIGVKLTKITPSRGFSIELGSALIVVTGSYLGLPLSTTHCQVGATAAVGLVEGAKGISWTVMIKAIIGWVATLIIVGFLSAIFMALGIFTPNLRSLQAATNIKETTNAAADQTLARLVEDGCARLAVESPDYQATKAFFQSTLENNFLFPNRVADAIEYMDTLNAQGCAAPAASTIYGFAQGLEYEAPEEEEE